MPVQITSSIFSFVDFNGEPEACNDAQVIMPAVNDFGIKFQVDALGIIPGSELWAVATSVGVPIISTKIQMSRLCGKVYFGIPFGEFPITVGFAVGAVPGISPGVYNTPEDLLNELNNQGEAVWIIENNRISTEGCCLPDFSGSYIVVGTTFDQLVGFIYSKASYYAEIPAIDMEGIVDIDGCFQYSVYDRDPEQIDAILLNSSNYFKRYAESCFLTKVEYWNTEDLMDFNYSDDDIRNSAWIFMYIGQPDNPTKEIIYIERSGKRRLESAIMDEEYEVITDRFTQWMHRKIEGMLIHDFKFFRNSYMGIVDEAMAKSAAYKKDWSDIPNIKDATAKFKLIKNLSYTNSNCGKGQCQLCDITVSDVIVTLVPASPFNETIGAIIQFQDTGNHILFDLYIHTFRAFDQLRITGTTNNNIDTIVLVVDPPPIAGWSAFTSVGNLVNETAGTGTVNIEKINEKAIYHATWLVDIIPDHYRFQFSLDDGISWNFITSIIEQTSNSIDYIIYGSDGDIVKSTNHKIRIAPICRTGNINIKGKAGIGTYTE